MPRTAVVAPEEELEEAVAVAALRASADREREREARGRIGPRPREWHVASMDSPDGSRSKRRREANDAGDDATTRSADAGCRDGLDTGALAPSSPPASSCIACFAPFGSTFFSPPVPFKSKRHCKVSPPIALCVGNFSSKEPTFKSDGVGLLPGAPAPASGGERPQRLASLSRKLGRALGVQPAAPPPSARAGGASDSGAARASAAAVAVPSAAAAGTPASPPPAASAPPRGRRDGGVAAAPAAPPRRPAGARRLSKDGSATGKMGSGILSSRNSGGGGHFTLSRRAKRLTGGTAAVGRVSSTGDGATGGVGGAAASDVPTQGA